MNDLESRIRDAFRGREGDAPEFDFSEARHVADRTRRRQFLNATVAGIGALVVVVAFTAGLSDLVRADQTPTPLDRPSPSPARAFATFSSALHEITIDYPAGWKVRPATEPWSGGRLSFDASNVDVIFDPTLGDDLYLALVSKPLGDLSRRDWVDDPNESLGIPGICAKTTGAGSGPLVIDQPSYFTSVHCSGGGKSSASGLYLRVATDTRGYLIYAHIADRPALNAEEETYVDLFQGMLDTVEPEYRDPSGGSS